MKKLLALSLAALMLLSGCSFEKTSDTTEAALLKNAVIIELDGEQTTADGKQLSNDPEQAVYMANDIVYYPTGQDFTFGEGTDDDAHEAAEADAHTVIHITKAGTYALSGRLSAGQIAVDLGEDAEDDEDAVVNLVLNGADISCTVAPAVIFYNVYECGDDDDPTEKVDTSAAGANVFIVDGTENNISGSYVARIYKPDSVELSDDGKEVKDAKKLHKYDAAFYSKMSMNINGGDGILSIAAENEGLDSEFHLTVNGGDIRITSGNDGINTNEDGVSVTTVNGGRITINVTGETGEGDGIDSNGWLVINGGTVISSACGFSGDAGIDSDMGIYINGGTVAASGNMLDHIAGGKQTYAVFSFASSQKGGTVCALKNSKGKEVISVAPENNFSYLIIASDELTAGDYSLYCNGEIMSVSGSLIGGGMGRPEGFEMPEGMERPEGMTPPEGFEMPEGMERPEGMTPPEGFEMPEGMERPEGMTPPEGFEIPEGMERPEGMQRPDWANGQSGQPGDASEIFTINKGGNSFTVISADRD